MELYRQYDNNIYTSINLTSSMIQQVFEATGLSIPKDRLQAFAIRYIEDLKKVATDAIADRIQELTEQEAICEVFDIVNNLDKKID